MGADLDDSELRRLALAGIAPEIEVLGSAARTASLYRLEGITATLNPATPDRSLFNSVTYCDPAALVAQLDRLAARYAEAGVRAWTVWVPDQDRKTAGVLEQRGHVLDAAPRLMALALSDRAAAPSAPDGYQVGPGDLGTLATINDIAYGIEGPAFVATLADGTSPRLKVLVATHNGKPVACVGTIEESDDLVVTAVATDPAHQGRRLCSAILGLALEQAAARGMATSSLRASKAGAGVYERLGYRDVGGVEMWEHRVPAPAS